MKSFIKLLVSIALICSCSSDESGDGQEFEGSGFTFEITGAINKTMTGSVLFYNENTTEVEDFEGNTTNLTTLLIVAEDDATPCQVIFAITREGNSIGSGNYDVGTDIFTFYNVFINFSGDQGESISYQSENNGSVNISSKGAITASGSLEAVCTGVGGGETITIKGNFSAESI